MATDIHDLEEAWRGAPGDPETFSALAGRYIGQGDWRKLVGLFDEGAPRLASTDTEYGVRLVQALRELRPNAVDSAEAGLILVAIGDACVNYLDDREQAMKAYQEAFKTNPLDSTSLERARNIYRAMEDYERVFLLYKLELKVRTEPGPRTDLLLLMAQVRGDYLEDFEGATQILEEAGKLSGDDPRVADLRGIYEKEGSFRDLLRETVSDAEEARAAGEFAMAAELYLLAARGENMREAGDDSQAADYAYEATRVDPSSAEAKAIFFELMRIAGREGELDNTGGSGVSMMAPVQVGESEAEVVNGASHAHEGAFQENIESAETQRIDLNAVANNAPQGEGQQLGEPTYVSEAESVSEPAVAEPAGEPPTEVSEGIDEDSELPEVPEPEEHAQLDSVASYVEALSGDPQDVDLLRGLYEVASETGDWEPLVTQYEKSLKRLRRQPGELETMLRLAKVLWKEVDDLERAEYYFKRIKLLDSENDEMLRFYEAYFEDRGEWRKLFAMLSTAQQHASDARKRELTERLAEIAEHSMASPEKAIDVWKSYTRDHQDDLDAREKLRTLYEENAKWSALVDFHKEDLHKLEEQGADGVERIELLRKMADIYDHQLGLEPMVINTLQDVLAIDPGDEAAFARLRELLVSNRRLNDLANLLSSRAEEAIEHGDVASASEHLTEVASIWMDNLKNVTQALPYLERVMEIDSSNAEVREKLKEVYEKRRDYASLFGVLRAEAAELSGDERMTQLRELVDLAIDRIRDPGLAVPVLNEILDEEPHDEEALNRLEFIHRRRDEHGELADVLVRRARVTDDLDKKTTMLIEAAAIREARLGQVDEAKAIWATILENNPADTRAMGALTRMYVASMEFDKLDAMYRDREALDQLYDLLDSAAATNESLDTRRALYRTMANLAENDLGEPQRVILSLESLLEIAEDRSMVARELIGWYQNVGDLEHEISMNELLLDEASEGDERLETLERLRELEGKREDRTGALRWALEAVKLAPDDEQVADEADRIARELDALEIYLQTLEDVAEVTEDEALQLRLWARIGRIQWKDLQNYGTATTYYERLYEEDPINLEWLAALERLYELSEEGEKRIHILRAQIDVLKEQGASEEDVVDEYRKVADVQRQMGDPDAARTTYREILDMDPEHLGALRGIKEIYRGEERWDDVTDCLVQELSLVPLDDEDHRIRVELELADAYRLNLGQPDEALRYYGQVLARVPDQADAVTAVETFLAEPSLAREAALLLEPIFRESQMHAPLVRALEARRAVSDDRFEEAEVLDELIPLYMEHLDDRATAFDRACRQFELDPDRSEIWQRLEQLGAQLDRWEDLEIIFSEYVPADKHAHPTRFDLLKHLAAIREYKLAMPDEALEAWEQLHDYDPLDVPTMEALDRLYRQQGRFESLVAILEARANVAEEPSDRVEMLVEAARIADEVVGDTSRTIDILRRVLIVEPDADSAVESLQLLLEREERWVELEELLANQADFAADPDRRRALQNDLAHVRWARLEDYVGATDVIRQLLANDPQDARALKELAALDERLETEDRGDLRLELVTVAEPLHRQNEDWTALVRALSTRLRYTEDPFDRVALLDELAELYVSPLEDYESAFAAVSEAVRIAPDDEVRRGFLEELGDKVGRVEDVLATFAAAADEADSYVAGDLMRRMGELYRDRMGLADEAIACFEHALEANSTDEELLAGLGTLYEQVADHEKLAENLRQQTIYGPPEMRAQFLRRIGIIENDVLQRPEAAISAFEELLEVEPDASDAATSLETLYEQEGRWLDLGDILRRQASMASDRDAQLSCLARLAVVQEGALDDRQSAIDTYREILAADSGNENALEQLERLHMAEEQWAELSEILRQKLVGSRADSDFDFRNTTELRLADVLATQLYAVDEALGLYRGVLERDPGNPSAIAAIEKVADDDATVEQVADDLIPHYIQHEDWTKLVDLYERLAERSHDPELQSDYYHRVAQIQRDGLANTDAAIDALARAWQLDVSRDELHDELLTLVAGSQDWSRLAQIYRDVLIEVTDPDRMLELRMLLASLYLDQIGDRDEAEVYYREALTVDERNVDAYAAIEQILTAGERWIDLVELLEAKFGATASSDPDGARVTLHRIAQVQEDLLEDGFSAVDTYNRILEIEPTDPDALSGIERLYRSQERWEDLNAHLVRRIDISSNLEEIVELKAEQGAIALEHLHDPLTALDLHREVLELQPEHAATIQSLQQIFESMEDFRVDAGRLLEPILRRHELWDNLVVILRDRAEHPDFHHEAPQLLREVGELARTRLGDEKLASSVYAQLFGTEPSDEEVRNALHVLAASRNDWANLAATYTRVLAENYEIPDHLRVELLVEQARIFEERLEFLDEARGTYEDVGGYDPEHRPTLEALDRIYSRQRDWTALADLYRRRADFTLDPDERGDWLYNLANLYEEILDDIDAAIDIYNELVAVDPTSKGPRRILERLLRQASRWADLANLYREQADASETDEERLDHRFRLAQVLEGELEQIDDALEIYRSIIAMNPTHFEARRALEGLLRDLAIAEADNKEYRVRIVDMLLETYDVDTDLEKVVSLLEEKGELLDDVPSRVGIQRQVADLLESSSRAEDRIRAMVALANAYRVDPGNADLKRRVNKIAMETGTWDKLIPLYLSGMELTDDPDVHANLLLAVAEIYQGPLSDNLSAVTAYQQVIEFSDDNEKALSQLEKLYSEMELWEPLVEVLLRRVDVVYDGEVQERLLRRVARVQEEILADPAAAVGAVERLREIDPANLEYISTLHRLYEEANQYEQLEELLRLKVGLVDDDAAQLKVLRNLARIQDENLHRPDDAIDSYRAVLSIDENDVTSVKALTRLYGRVERWPELLEALELERDFAEGVPELNAVELRMGIVLAERLNAGHEAIEMFNRVLERDPHFAAARGAMRKLLANPDTGVQVQAILETLFREQQEWLELEKLYESLLQQVEELDRRREAYARLANLQENELDNTQMAFITWGRATREEPGYEVYRENLERLATKLNTVDELLAVYEDCLEGDIDDPDVQLYLHNRLGDVYTQLEAFEEAIGHFEKSLEIDQHNVRALKALDELFQIEQQWEKLAMVLEREIAVVDPTEVNDARYRLGYLNEVMFENQERALDLYAQLLLEEPGHMNTVEAMMRLVEAPELRERIIPILEPILIDLGEWERLVHMYGLQLDGVEDPIDKSQVLEKIANVHLDHLGNMGVGYAYLSRALRADPGNVEVQIRLETLVDATDMHEELVALYEEIIEDLDDPIRVVELALVAGTFAYGTLDDVGRAWKTFEKILTIDRDNEAALAAMEEIARYQGDPESLAAVLAREAEIVFDPDQLKRILIDLGSVRMELEEFDKSIEAYRKALEIDESDATALAALVELLEITEQYGELVDLMQRLVMFETDPNRQLQLYVRMGRYSRVLLHDAPRAVDAYRNALAISPEDDEVLEALQELYEETEEWETLRKILGRRVKLNDPRAAVSMCVRMAEISHKKFNEVERAIEEYSAALKIEPSDEVMRALGGLYRDEERWSELLAMYERVLESTPGNDPRAITLQVEMADISAKYLGDEQSAIRYLEQILEAEPTHLRALAVLADLYGQQGDWERGLKVMDRRMKACRTVDEQIEALLHRAQIFEKELNRPKDAANDYVRVVEMSPLHEEALGALKSLYGEQLGAHKAMYDIVKYEASHRPDPEKKAELYLQMASIAREQLNDPAHTIEALELAYALRPSDLEIVEPLLDAYIMGGSTAKAEPLIESIIEQLRSERRMKEVVRFLHLQGRLAEQKGDLDAAYQAYDATHKVDASYIPNLLSLGKLLYVREEWDDALKIFQTLLLHQMNIEKDSDKVDIYYHLGMVRWHQGDARRAKDMFNRALNIDSNHGPSREAMSQL